MASLIFFRIIYMTTPEMKNFLIYKENTLAGGRTDRHTDPNTRTDKGSI